MKLSKAERRARQKAFERKQNMENKLVYAIPVISAILFLLTGWLKPLTIGNDIRYTIFVIVLPILIGLILFLAFRNKVLDGKAIAATNGKQKIINSIVLVFIVSLFSFLTLGTAAIIVFEATNYNIAEKSEKKSITLPVEDYFKGTKRSGINFFFEGHRETLQLDRTAVTKYESSGHKHIKLTIRKGIWNHYIVDEYEFIR